MTHPPIDVVWTLFGGMLVFVMLAGFMCLESGMVRQKNSINVAIKNMTAFLISCVSFFLVGFAIMFGSSYHGWFGTEGWGLSHYIAVDKQAWIYTFFFFQVMFCSTAAAIVSGGVAERMGFGGYMLVSLVISTLIYPVFGHWAWGGSYDLAPERGWLAALGYRDFAGSSVVHIVGGIATLACLVILGPRKGRYNPDGSSNKIRGSNLALSTLGVFLLWFGWFGFNAGSTLAVTRDVGLILVNTNLAACAGALTCLAYAWLSSGKPEVEAVLIGALGGLVAITASCAFVTPAAALMIGVLGGITVTLVTKLLDHLQIDDVVGAVPVHAGCGIVGVLSVGLFAQPQFLVHGSRMEQLLVQGLGALVCVLFTFAVAWLVFTFINKFVTRLRVPPDDEERGLNVSEHGARTLWLDMAKDMHYIEQSDDLTRRVAVETETEAGVVATLFNKLMDTLQVKSKSLTDTNVQLQASHKELEAFSYSVSHDLRAPLRSMDSFSRIILEDYGPKLDKEGNRLLNVVCGEAQRMGRLIDDLLDFSRMNRQEMKATQCDMTQLAQSVYNRLDESLRSRIQHFNLLPLPPAYGDLAMLRQVLFNLLANAVKFTGHQQSPAIEVGASSAGGINTYYVKDNGVGFDQGYVHKLFGVFQRLHAEDEFEGTGVGLALVQRIIHRHGGEVWAEGKLNAGATFYFTLPILKES